MINKQLFTHPLHATGFFKAIFKRFGNTIGFAGLSCVCGLVTFKNKHIFFLGKNKFDKRGLFEPNRQSKAGCSKCKTCLIIIRLR